MEIFYISVIMVLVLVIILLNERHKDEIADIYAVHRKEREKLLDRIMANNIHEFKSATGEMEVKRSETGNFLMDRMKITARKQFREE